ncbi:hypothetical protein C8R46DRAFT_1153689, partial [Mycena filopes]
MLSLPPASSSFAAGEALAGLRSTTFFNGSPSTMLSLPPASSSFAGKVFAGLLRSTAFFGSSLPPASRIASSSFASEAFGSDLTGLLGSTTFGSGVSLTLLSLPPASSFASLTLLSSPEALAGLRSTTFFRSPSSLPPAGDIASAGASSLIAGLDLGSSASLP